MKTRTIVHAFLLLVLLLALALEAALWLRAVGAGWVQEAYPFVAVGDDDRPIYWRQGFREVRGRRLGFFRFYDEERNLIREVDYARGDDVVGMKLPHVTASPRLVSRV